MNSITNDLVGTCSICKRRHDNIGWAASERHPVKWMCWDCLDLSNPKGLPINFNKVFHMSQRKFDEYEERALEDGGNAGGSFLDEIGKTDLAELDPEEWSQFLGVILKGYADSMREIVSREVPY